MPQTRSHAVTLSAREGRCTSPDRDVGDPSPGDVAKLTHQPPEQRLAFSATIGPARLQQDQRGYTGSMNELKFLELHGDRVAYRDAG
jgi:hypothetical protein